ncbi:MAG: ABC transporter transmembrane domain-containing protein [Pseudomonadota bacterium]
MSPSIVAASLTSNVLGLALPLVMIQLYDRVIPNQGYDTLIVLGIGLAVAIVVDAILKLARGSLMARAGAAYELRSNASAIRTILTDPSTERTAPGVLYNELSQIDRVRRFHTGDAGAALLDVPFILLFLIAMLWISPVLGGTILLLMSGVFVAVRLMRRQIVELTNKRIVLDGRRQSFLIETLGGFESVKALGAEGFMERRYERLMAGSAPIGATLAEKVQMTQGVTGAVGLLGPVVTAGVGAYLVMQGQLTVGALAAMVLLTGRIVQPALRLEALLIGDTDVRGLEKALAPLVSPPTAAATPQLRSRIETVTLALRGDQDRLSVPDGVLTELSLRRGDCVCLNGSEGSGRSSLLAAIAGNRTVDGIQVALNGQPLGSFDQTHRTEKVSFMVRGAAPLSGTLLENLTRFQPERYRAQAMELVGELGLDQFIAHHPKGLDLRLGGVARGELPNSISDLVQIVAGLVANPDVILFDQANAALDQQSDARLLDLLGRLQPEKIIILVTNRPEYRQIANKHFSMENGQLREDRLAPPLDLGRYARQIA